MHPRLRNSSPLGGVFSSRITLWIGLTLLFISTFFLFAMLNPSKHGGTPRPVIPLTGKCQQAVDQDMIPDNSNFYVTTESKAYDVHKSIKCFKPGCDKARNNKRAFEPCSNEQATEWNTVGAHSMERVVLGELKDPVYYYTNSLGDAVRAFEKAIALDANCYSARLNLGLALAFNRSHAAANTHFKHLLDEVASDLSVKDIARVHVFAGLNMENKMGRIGTESVVEHYDKVRELDSDTEHEFWGIVTTSSGSNNLYNYGRSQEPDALQDLLAWKWFAPRSIPRWTLLDPGTPDWFTQNRYIVLRKVLPPLALRSVARCYRRLIGDGILKLGDAQSKRYTAYNDRCARFLHFELTDLVRRVVAHNARPSYTYFGGYVAGADLKPHHDRDQCEWTMSLQVEQTPHDKIWLLSLDKKPGFDRDPSTRPRAEIPDNEDDIADADLYEGDALLFMGRHLAHFRRGVLPEGQTTTQVFMHWVPDNFAGSLT